MAKPDVSVEKLRLLLHYDELAGTFTRNVPSGGKLAGSIAGMKCKRSGYVLISVANVQYPAHRLAWLYVFRKWPEAFIDHINGIRDDNRIENLRDVPQSINRENQHVARSDNVLSGVIGVTWSEYHKKWKAHIRVAGTLKHLKYCETKEEARLVYIEAKKILHAGCTEYCIR